MTLRQTAMGWLTRKGVREAALLTVLVWLVADMLWATPDLTASERAPDFLWPLLAETFAIGVGFSTLVSILIEATHALARWPRIVAIAAVVLGVAVLHGWIDAMIVMDMRHQAGLRNATLYSEFIGGLMPFVLVYGLHATAVGLMLTSIAVQEQQRLVAEARHAAQQAQLAVLRFQLNPHFLFNTLNAISSLIVTGDNTGAEAMTVKLAQFLQTSLQADPEGEVTLDDELATIHTYLDIEAVRFGERLVVRFECPTQLLSARVPSFLLQPLVENAVKYGVAPSRRPVTVSVSVAREGDDIRIVVEDDGGQAFGTLPKGGTGLGLNNVRRRLDAFYGARGQLEAVAHERGYRVTLRLPFRHRQAETEAA